MKYYAIDEIPSADMDKVSAFLKSHGSASGLEKIFWVNLPDEYLNTVQAGHTDCRPYFFAVELGRDIMKAELYVRTLKGLKCTCSGYSDPEQSRFIINFIDEIVKELKLRT
jgi:hypothetical protein